MLVAYFFVSARFLRFFFHRSCRGWKKNGIKLRFFVSWLFMKGRRKYENNGAFRKTIVARIKRLFVYWVRCLVLKTASCFFTSRALVVLTNRYSRWRAPIRARILRFCVHVPSSTNTQRCRVLYLYTLVYGDGATTTSRSYRDGYATDQLYSARSVGSCHVCATLNPPRMAHDRKPPQDFQIIRSQLLCTFKLPLNFFVYWQFC